MKVLTRITLTSKNKNERDDAKILKKSIDSYEVVLFIVIWERFLPAIGGGGPGHTFVKVLRCIAQTYARGFQTKKMRSCSLLTFLLSWI